MRTKIYDHANNAVEIDLQDKPIKEIYVRVLSGDEVVTVTYKDGTQDEFDSSDCRMIAYYDGGYFVEEKDIEKWLNYKAEESKTNSYNRMYIF